MEAAAGGWAGLRLEAAGVRLSRSQGGCQNGVCAGTLQCSGEALLQARDCFAPLLWLCWSKSLHEPQGIFSKASVVFYGERPRHAVAVFLVLPLSCYDRGDAVSQGSPLGDGFDS